MEAWAAPAATGPIDGLVEVPSSKSLTARYLLLAAIADAPVRVHRPLVSRDSILMLDALTTLGVGVERSDDDATWTLTPPDRLRGGVDVECGLAGTVMRFVPALAVSADGPVHFDGDPEARTRPVGPLVQALTDLGARVTPAGATTLPFTVDGTEGTTAAQVRLDASASSQFVSALLLAAPRLPRGLRVEHVGGRLPSLPHIEMTVQVLRAAGVDVEWDGGTSWQVAPGPVHLPEVEVEPDLSSAAPLVAAAAATGGVVRVRHWPQQTTQAGDAMREILTAFGATVQRRDDVVEVTGPPHGRLRPVTLDLHRVGELTPVVAALCALAEGTSTLTGVAHLRGHETDRLQALHDQLRAVGAEVEQLQDGLRITGGRTLHPTRWNSYADHRMAMSGAVIGLRVPGLQVLDIATTSKTYPGFAQAWTDLVAGRSAGVAQGLG